jgi:hypothetical protein
LRQPESPQPGPAYALETLAGRRCHALRPPELARDGLDLYGFNAWERLEGVDDLRSHLEQVHAHRIREEQSDQNVAAVLLDVGTRPISTMSRFVRLKTLHVSYTVLSAS